MLTVCKVMPMSDSSFFFRFFFKFQARMLGGGGAKNWPKKYNIDYFGYAVNLEFKFKLNFDQERGPKIEKKVKIQKKIE